MVTSSTKQPKIYEVTPIEASATDIAAWQTINIGTAMQADWDTNVMVAHTKIGLFGHDLTSFWVDCATETSYCDETEYQANYDGWAMGQYWYLDSLADMQAATDMKWIDGDYSVATCWASTEECTYVKSIKNSNGLSGFNYGHELGLGYTETFSASEPTNLAALTNGNYMEHWDNSFAYGYGFNERVMWSNIPYDNSNSYSSIWPQGTTFFRF